MLWVHGFLRTGTNPRKIHKFRTTQNPFMQLTKCDVPVARGAWVVARPITGRLYWWHRPRRGRCKGCFAENER